MNDKPAEDSAAIDTGPPEDTAPPDTDEPGDTGPEDTGPIDTGDPPPIDADGDGFTEGIDCDDSDPSVYPGASEVCGDHVVNDCDDTAADARAECATTLTATDAIATWSLGYNQSDPTRAVGVGDIDGDGYDDIAVGYTTLDSTAISTGGLYLYQGPVGGFYSHGSGGRLIFGVEQFDSVGWDIAGLGDVDGDGYDDFVVGAPDDHHNTSTTTPEVYRIHGPADITTIAEAVLLVENPGTVECLGSVMEPVPDVDGDGATDLLVGGRCAGVVRLISGGAATTQAPGTDDITTFIGPSGDSRFGHGIATGDLDADGSADVAIGAPDFHGDEALGFVAVSSSPGTGTVSYADAVATVSAQSGDSSMGYVLLGSGVAVGDLNSDGYDDLAAGGPMWSTDLYAAREEGIIVVYFGPLSGDYGLSDADFTMYGHDGHEGLGGEMHADQDLDGDGEDDLLAASGYVEINGNGGSLRPWPANMAYLLRAPLPTGSLLAEEADVIFTDPNPTVFGEQAVIAGDTNGDGATEVLVGNWYDTIHLFDIPPGY